jgi:hypothetical protein
MKRLLILIASLLVCTMFAPPGAHAESIACAAAVPTPPKGQWYYRLIDGRKCWYEGKPMLPKSSLHWPKETPVVEAEAMTPLEAEAATPVPDIRPSTDGRSISTSPPADPNIWPAPARDDTSFESRWQALKPRN